MVGAGSLDANNRACQIFCVTDSRGHSVGEHDGKAVERPCNPHPVPDGHGPAFGGTLDCQVQDLDHRRVVVGVAGGNAVEPPRPAEPPMA